MVLIGTTNQHDLLYLPDPILYCMYVCELSSPPRCVCASSVTVMDVRNETMLAVSTTLNGRQVLTGVIGNTYAHPLPYNC